MQTKSYLFNLSYGHRVNELKFIKDILSGFNNETLTGVVSLVNNNPYNLEFLLYLAFEKEDYLFDQWLDKYYPQKKLNYLFNYSLDEIIKDQLGRNRYNAHGFSTIEQAENMITDEPNAIFLFPSIKVIAQKWGKMEKMVKYTVFLSHSSDDKVLVESIFKELQKDEIKAWFDKYEIKAGDSITDKLNEGLSNSDLGILFLSKSFLNSNWAKSEMNYFFRQAMVSGKKKFIIVNIDLKIHEIPPLLQDYRHIDITRSEWMQELIAAIEELKAGERN